MANADGHLFNIDRWTIYTLQRLYPNHRFYTRGMYHNWGGNHVEPTAKQFRRMLKKSRKNKDFSIVLARSLPR